MKFRTEITIKDAPRNLSPERLVLLMGSCFSDYMGEKMEKTGWKSLSNPCGVVYNPVSMAVLFQLALTHRALRRDIIEASITGRESKYASWLMGSIAVADDKITCIDKVCEAIDRLEEGLETADALILTFGTPDVWLLKGTDRSVGNCHKHPASEFEKRRLSIDEIAETWESLIQVVRDRNPELKVIVTVSPRRYLSEGFEDNSRQKAILLLACEKLCRNRNSNDKNPKNITYFPSYEILNDDLRDYRFYAKDLLHPSEQAVEYIWEKFTEAYLSDSELDKLRKLEKETKRRLHRPQIP